MQARMGTWAVSASFLVTVFGSGFLMSACSGNSPAAGDIEKVLRDNGFPDATITSHACKLMEHGQSFECNLTLKVDTGAGAERKLYAILAKSNDTWRLIQSEER